MGVFGVVGETCVVPCVLLLWWRTFGEGRSNGRYIWEVVVVVMVGALCWGNGDMLRLFIVVVGVWRYWWE